MYNTPESHSANLRWNYDEIYSNEIYDLLEDNMISTQENLVQIMLYTNKLL